MNPIPHPIEEEEWTAFLDGELPCERAKILTAHLEQCAECRLVVAEFRSVSKRLAAWQIEPSPARLAEHLKAALGTWEPPAKTAATIHAFGLRERPKPLIPRWAWGLATGAAALALLVVISVPNLLRSRMAADQASRASRRTYPASPDMKAGEEATPAPSLGPTGPMIVQAASLSLVTKDFDLARAAVERIALAHRGFIAQLNVSGQAGQSRLLTATLRVPADQLGAALGELKQLGRVEQESQSGEEITQQFVDLNARLTNARHTEQRLTEVLSQRTGQMTDVLQVEREIARVRGEIERMDAQRKNMQDRVAFATVQLRLSQEYKAEVEVVPASAPTQLRNAIVEGYRALLDNVLGLMLVLLRYGPSLLFWLIIAFWPARFVWRRLRA